MKTRCGACALMQDEGVADAAPDDSCMSPSNLLDASDLAHPSPRAPGSSTVATNMVGTAAGNGTAAGIIRERLTSAPRGVPYLRSGHMQVLRLAKKGDVPKAKSKEALFSVCACLEHPQRCVRASALEALGKLCTRGDWVCLDMIFPLLENKVAGTREAAAEAMALVALPGDPLVLSRLISLCNGAVSMLLIVRVCIHVNKPNRSS